MAAFDEARREALMGDLLRLIRRKPVDLLPFDEVRERLRLRSLVDRGVSDVPLDRIVGSLGRAREFNRAFLPREEELRERWDDVHGMAIGHAGLRTVELYGVGEVYFVIDGHHRVSVARSLGAPSIEAHVKEFMTPVSIQAGDSMEDVVLRSARADFLATTGLEATSDDDLRLTSADGYERLLDHISVHRYFRGIDLHRPFGWEEAVASWRDLVYRPMTETIQGSGILEEFPGRTEADLYLFTMDHLHRLRETYGPESVGENDAVRHFMDAQRPRRGLAALWRRLAHRGEA